MERDRGCILTKVGPVEVAHIYPFSMRHVDDMLEGPSPTFWDALKMLWKKDRITAWQNAIFSTRKRTEIVQNLVSLSPTLHTLWGSGDFALKPIQLSDDRKTLDLEFHWLHSRKSKIAIPLQRLPPATYDMLEMPSLKLPEERSAIQTAHSNVLTGEKLISGYKTSITTEDPDRLPLPDIALLEMQWTLQRISALSGAAEPESDFLDDDSSEEEEIGSSISHKADVGDDSDVAAQFELL
jgi:hypothetical protein